MTDSHTTHPLLPTMPIDPHRPVLFCLPHAGGGTSLFYRWRRYLPGWLQIAPLRLPAREDRLRDPHYASFELLVDDVAVAIESTNVQQFAMIGHSKGSYVAFEAARLLADNGGTLPNVLVVAGATAPQLVKRTTYLHELPDKEFVAEMRRRYDGLPSAVVADERLLNIVLPALRGDMRLVETYEFAHGPQLACDIMALGGLNDPGVNYDRLAAWQELTNATFTVQMFNGGHFFLHPDARPAVADLQPPPTVTAVLELLAERFGESA